MKIRIWSDLHLEGAALAFSQTCHDEVLVLAGDIHNNPGGLAAFCDTMAKLFKAVVVVPGNHEYYKGVPVHEFPAMFRALVKSDNVHFLNTRSVLIDDVLFIGATLWTNFDEGDPVVTWAAKRGINDFNLINSGTHAISTIGWMAREHEFDLNFIRESCKSNSGKKVVITHFPPLREFQHPRWGSVRQNPINAYFVNELSHKIQDLDFNIWIAGHTHDPSDFEKYGKRFICNPRGYAYRGTPENAAFDINKVVEV